MSAAPLLIDAAGVADRCSAAAAVNAIERAFNRRA